MLSTHSTCWFKLMLQMPSLCIILPHDINSLFLGVTGYHFHLFFFSFLGLSKLNSTEQWCLSLSELSCRTIFAFETSSTSTPTSPNRTTTGFRVCTCTFHCCFDLFQLKAKMKTEFFYFKCWTGPLNGCSDLGSAIHCLCSSHTWAMHLWSGDDGFSFPLFFHPSLD